MRRRCSHWKVATERRVGEAHTEPQPLEEDLSLAFEAVGLTHIANLNAAALAADLCNWNLKVRLGRLGPWQIC